MADPCVREIGRVMDIDGIALPVGVDYDTVSVGGLRLDHAAQEEFARLFVAACWRAAQSLPLVTAVRDGV